MMEILDSTDGSTNNVYCDDGGGREKHKAKGTA